MLQTLIDQKTVKPGNWSSLTVFLWFQLSKMGLYTFSVENNIVFVVQCMQAFTPQDRAVQKKEDHILEET